MRPREDFVDSLEALESDILMFVKPIAYKEFGEYLHFRMVEFLTRDWI